MNSRVFVGYTTGSLRQTPADIPIRERIDFEAPVTVLMTANNNRVSLYQEGIFKGYARELALRNVEFLSHVSEPALSAMIVEAKDVDLTGIMIRNKQIHFNLGRWWHKRGYSGAKRVHQASEAYLSAVPHRQREGVASVRI